MSLSVWDQKFESQDGNSLMMKPRSARLPHQMDSFLHPLDLPHIYPSGEKHIESVWEKVIGQSHSFIALKQTNQICTEED